MVRRFINLLIFVLTCILVSQAQDVSFSVNSPGNVIQGRKFALTFRLKNGQATPPKAPQLEHCELLYGPATSTMSSSTYVNGRVSSSTSVDYSFTYVAKEAGKVTVPAVSISSGGKQYTSQQITFQIFPADKESDADASAQGNATRRPVHVDDINTQTPGPVSANDLFVRISLSRDKVYEQEAIIATIKVYTKYQISGFLANTQPSFDGFISEELPVNNNLQPDHLNGQNYYSAELKKAIIYPQKSGKLTISSGKYDITIVQYQNVSMGFFTTREPVEKKVVTQSNSVTVNVEALPSPAPEGFNGAVGRYTIASELTPARLLTNEAANYKLTIKGTGNIKLITEPTINFPHGFDEYTPNKEVDARFNGSDMTGTATIDYTVVPQEVGKAQIPAVAFTYFDPTKREYVTLHTEAYDVNVGRGAGAPVSVEQKEIDKSMNDILHIKTTHAETSGSNSQVFFKGYYWCIYIAALLILVAVVIIYRKQMQLNSDLRRQQLTRATKLAKKRFKLAHTAMHAHEHDKFYEELSKALWGYLSDKLGIPASQLLRDNISSALINHGADEETIKNVIGIIDECEMARFTPAHSDDEMSVLYDKAVSVIKDMENIKK